MHLNWFGQSCFLLTSQAGTRVLMDPFGKGMGYRVPDLQADIVTTSHDHFDHNNIASGKGQFRTHHSAGSYTHKDITIHGVVAFHDAPGR